MFFLSESRSTERGGGRNKNVEREVVTQLLRLETYIARFEIAEVSVPESIRSLSKTVRNAIDEQASARNEYHHHMRANNALQQYDALPIHQQVAGFHAALEDALKTIEALLSPVDTSISHRPVG